jgi:hypothetical protein
VTNQYAFLKAELLIPGMTCTVVPLTVKNYEASGIILLFACEHEGKTIENVFGGVEKGPATKATDAPQH